nr:hypothetical protein [uncultured Desulfuromonas sp.]
MEYKNPKNDVCSFRGTLLAAICLVVFFCLTGCGVQPGKYAYPVNNNDLYSCSMEQRSCKTVAVAPFEDVRGTTNHFGTYFLYWIPLSPGGYIEYERPDTARTFGLHFTPTDDLAKSAVYSLQKSNLFEEAFLSFRGDKSQADYLLEGEIISTRFQSNQWSYGLSVYGPTLWLIGLPAGSTENDLALSLTLTDLKTGELLWQNQYEMNNKVIQGLYYNLTDGGLETYARLMQDIMNQAVFDMSTKLSL